ncbi:MAG TPA: DUF58 domain-containing protein [Aromatoleum sp.]|uniref:DUF58 domain-containing protein n=1 Tax=Aromatoleum sp. TaxID=2307007 RepID=UPI002B4A7665|nr:DUF58 domain-containing protein [Aromatoleum sp.]HJV25019.1 DUF58 domain-containing protein [Aromatoleum sp.]
MPALRNRLRRFIDHWLFRVGPSEHAPIVLRQRRIFVLPTRSGIVFALALAVMLLASINYNLSLGFGLVFLIAGVAVASIVHAFRNLLHLSLSPGRAESVFAGDVAHFTLLLSNTRAAGRPGLRCSTRAGAAALDLGPSQTTEVTLPLATPTRGWHRPGRVTIETTYPLGLIRAWSIVTPDIRCLAYPTPEPDPPTLPRGPTDQSTGRRSGLGDDDFAGLRPHRLSDSPRHVAWKNVARGGPMLTKEFAGAEGGAVELDWHDLPANLDVEQRLSRFTAWILTASVAGRPFALSLPHWAAPASSDPRHISTCLRQLALYSLQERDDE